MRGHWNARFIEASHLDEAEKLTEEDDVLCIEGNYLQSSDARNLVTRFLATGRGVFIMMNRISPLSKAWLKELGIEALETQKNGRAHFQYIYAAHPILYPFTLPDYGNLMEVEVTDPINMRYAQAVPLIFTEKGEAILMEKKQSAGRLLVQSFAFDRQQTTWPVHVTFLPYLDLCLQHLRPVDPTPTVFEPSSVLSRVFQTNSGVKALVLKNGANMERADVTGGRVRLKLPRKPGFYSVTCEGGNEPERTICVNPSHKESDLHYTNQPVALQSWVLPRTTQTGVVENKGTSTSAIMEQKVWWWLLMGALIGLACETAVSNFRRRNT
jgi:hypothetical protein